VLDHAVVAAGHVVRRDHGGFDLALERGRKAVPYSGKTDFELIVHEGLPWLLCTKHLPQVLSVGQVSRLIYRVDNILIVRPAVRVSNVAART
jgi:hypothetical protein